MQFHKTGVFAALALAILGTPALAGGPYGHAYEAYSTGGPRVYAYEGAANYCPAGLQPVTINGAICCGTPNQHQSYQQAQRHPVTHIRSARPRYDSCPPGQKGCS